ncbi:MAG: prolipoprotein diacylglyceryl transferase [Clostridiales bacterium]|nr:prolipoprotein diacylglyceryl transferase [Clostridiales bacterium]
MNYLSFPGLGIEPFHVERIAFRAGPFTVAWYGILITFGMILAVLCAVRLSKREGISLDDITDFAFYVILSGVIGARAYYVIFTWNKYHYLVTGGSFLHNLARTLYNVIAVWEGGLAIYGGVLAGLLCGYLFAKKRKIPFLKIYDILAPCVLIGQIIGRWGNFLNIEAYGTETTLPWRMGILEYATSMSGESALISEQYVHPTFLYESLWNLVGLVLVLALLYPKKKFDGQIFCFYLVWYGFGRMLIESLRTDSLMLGNLRVSQGVGFLSLVLGILIFTILYKKRKEQSKEKDDDGGYVPVYAEAAAAEENKPDETEEEKAEETEKKEEKEEKEEGELTDGGENS